MFLPGKLIIQDFQLALAQQAHHLSINANYRPSNLIFSNGTVSNTPSCEAKLKLDLL